MKKNELLSPAGDFESFKSAVQNGADAIYMGVGKYNARQMANNFTLDEYVDAIFYAHVYGVKIYLTLNTLMYNKEFKEALELVINLYSHGLDGVILQDIGLAMQIKSILPDLAIHASTQMSVHNLKQVEFLEKLGFSRVVLARELTIDEIENICKNTNIEIEVFVHGALCVSYSGQCLMSSMIGGRSGNRGACAQPCRMKCSLYSDNGKLIEKSRYILSRKDIFGLGYLKKLVDIGVKSFKIEGRSKTPEYVGLVTSKYRKYIDKNTNEINDIDKEQLLQMFNRDGISTGYLDGVKYKKGITLNSPKNMGTYLGELLDQKKEYIKVKLEQDIDLHDGIEIYDERGIVSNIVTCIRDQNFKTINTKVLKSNIVWLGDISRKVKYASKIYKTSSSELNEEIRKTYRDNKYIRKVNISAKISILNGENIKFSILDKNIVYELEYIPQIAKNKAIDNDYIYNCILKTNDTPFVFDDLEINLDSNLFVPISKLNELRRNVIELLYNSYKINIDVSQILTNLDNYLNIDKELIEKKKLIPKESIYLYKFKDIDNYLNKGINNIYINMSDLMGKEVKIKEKYSDYNIYACIPNIVNKNLDRYISNNLEYLINMGYKGFVVGNIGYIEALKDLKHKHNITLIADYSLNIINSYSAIFFKNQGFDIITISMELPKDEIKNISRILPVEIVKDYITVMTSRYCIIGSFVANRVENCKCSMPCINNTYFLEDSYGLRYNIICDNIDCIMKIVRKINENYDESEISNLISIRNCKI